MRKAKIKVQLIATSAQRQNSRQKPARVVLDDGDWETLLNRIKDGKCTPFLGAGANVDILPVAESLAKKWAETYHYPLKDSNDLTKVSQFLAIHNDPMWPKEEILRLFKEHEVSQSPLEVERRFGSFYATPC